MSATTKRPRKRAKDGTFRGGARPGAGRKPRAPVEIEPEPVLDDDAYATALLSRVMRDDQRSLEMRARAAAAILGRSASRAPVAPSTPDPAD